MTDNNNSSRRFEALFRYATLGIIVTDSTGTIIDVNPYAEQQFGYIKDELIGQKVEILIPTHLAKKHVHYRQEFYGAPHNRSMGAGRDLNARKKDGSEFPVEISLSHYTADDSLYVIAFIVDISLRKKSEEAIEKQSEEILLLNTKLEKKVEDRTKMLQETLAELEQSKLELSDALKKEKELSDLKSAFVTMASHEFRTPLSTILSSASLIGKYTEAEGQEKREKHLMRIKDAVLNMKTILEDFLSLGKLEEGVIKAKPTTLTGEEFSESMTHILEDMQMLEKPGQKIQLDVAVDNDVTLDHNLFKNIFVNLVSNAIKFSPEESLIAVSVKLNSDELELSVTDHGIGISEEDQKHLFERFFRAKNASNINGTGLGLHIISKYLELMHGHVKINSRLNEGTTFLVTLPLSAISK